MISEQSFDRWDNNPVKLSNVKYPQTKYENAPKKFWLSFVVHMVLVNIFIDKIIEIIREKEHLL